MSVPIPAKNVGSGTAESLSPTEGPLEMTSFGSRTLSPFCPSVETKNKEDTRDTTAFGSFDITGDRLPDVSGGFPIRNLERRVIEVSDMAFYLLRHCGCAFSSRWSGASSDYRGQSDEGIEELPIGLSPY